MSRLRWTDGAIADLEHIRRYVTAVHRDAARRLADRIAAVAHTLVADSGDVGPAIRERAIVYPYLVRYRIQGRRTIVMAVRHSSDARIV